MQRKSILIVEDDPDIRSTLEQILLFEGYLIHLAGNGQEALDALARIPEPGAILLDLMMPIMNGWEFLEVARAREEIARIPVVILSASRGAVDRYSVFGSLTKPVDLDALLATLRKAIPEEA